MTQSLSKVLSRQFIKNMIVVGDVVDNNDPEKLLRIRVRVPLVHRDVTDGNLPWARPITLAAVSGMTGTSGAIAIPAKGSKVALIFTDESLYNACYLGSMADTETLPDELLEGYPDSYGWIDSGGNLVFVNTKTKEMKLVHVSGSKFFIKQDGAIDIVSAAKINVSSQTDIEILAANSVRIHGGPSIDVRASRIDLNKSTSGNSPETVQPRTVPTARNVAGKTSL